MPLDASSCYRALATHDRRFDGRFFVGVATTRIYCRPVCTVRTPRRENCRFFRSAAAAEEAGYRPCLRCRPELAPGNASIDSAERLAQAAIALIDEGVLERGGIEALARSIGVTSRHLRRIFLASFGVSPVAYAQTHRLLLAKRLLTDTMLPVTDIAFAAGFGSVRRLNALFSERYRLAPARLRRDATAVSARAPLSFELAYRPPYHWPAMLDFLRARALPGVDRVDARRYMRTLRVAQRGEVHVGAIAVAPVLQRSVLHVEISAGLAKAIAPVLTRVRHAFDLACDPEAVTSTLGALAQEAPGLRVPGAFEGFELAVRAIVGQQVSVAAARTLLGRIVEALGERVQPAMFGVDRLFPTPEGILECGESGLRALGILPSRARTVGKLARLVQDGVLTLEPHTDLASTLRTLRDIPGIGDWTAEMIAMRALGWPDAFPATDVVLRRAMGVASAAQSRARSLEWQPWRSYAVMHLWRNA